MRGLKPLLVLSVVLLSASSPAQVMYYVQPTWVPVAPVPVMVVPPPAIPMTLERYYILPSASDAPPASSTDATSLGSKPSSEPTKASDYPAIIIREYHLSTPGAPATDPDKLRVPPWREEFARPPITDEPMIVIPVIPTEVPPLPPSKPEPAQTPDESVPV